uniref:Uncharacterized protein n=1 Tax=Oncorhynchus tshawytscha TaxID=74940 RepID=A0AAZ3QXD0_ONCTS
EAEGEHTALGEDREELLELRVPLLKTFRKVLKVSLIGHRKRILASLGDRLHQDPPQKPPRAISLREPGGCNTPPQILPGQAAYTTAGVPGARWTCSTSSCRRTHGAASAPTTTT